MGGGGIDLYDCRPLSPRQHKHRPVETAMPTGYETSAQALRVPRQMNTSLQSSSELMTIVNLLESNR